MPRGGKRTGAGRPQGTGKYGEPTKAVRLPISIADKVLSSLSSHSTPEVQLQTIVQSISKSESETEISLPLYLNPVAAGFPAPTEDYIEDSIDLNRYFIKHPETTFLVRVTGDSMQDAGIHPNDMLIVDRSIEVHNGRVVIAVVNGELTVKRILKNQGKLFLMPENKSFNPIEIDEHTDLHIWGVVTNVIHAL